MRVEPAKSKLIVVHQGHVLRLEMPTAKSWIVVPFMAFWLVSWGFGEISVIKQLLAHDSAQGFAFAQIFMLAWLCAWTIGGGFALFTVLSMIAGREVVELSGNDLKVRHEIVGIGRSRTYTVNDIRNLRVSVQPAVKNRQPGLVAFDYGATTIRFGSGLQEPEAAEVIAHLTARNPTLADHAQR